MTTGSAQAAVGLRREADRYDAVADAACELVIRRYSTSFHLACRLLPEPVRRDVKAVYALVRIADELVDNPYALVDPSRGRTLLDALESDTLGAVEHGGSANLVVHAFAGAARRCGIDAGLIIPFFASMRADLEVVKHDQESFDRYVYGSAEVVGLMCLRVFLWHGADHTGTPSYAELAPGARRLGAAFQKVNFLRDLAADRNARGRCYFPGVEPGELTDAEKNRLLDDVDDDLAAAAPAMAALPPSSRRAVAVAAALFTELSARLRRASAREVLSERVRVPASVKARVVASTLVGLVP
ncbi:MAG TPA: squalene/phytoene synthase family protein [Actinomycetales bacterium]|nr:squalene/phytoene synthase family protein [Actinomycetales bacterium]